ncbi:MAG TPA: GNAT family N-acetyltransferase [Terrisporobacter glycolicus]|uniref:GNAT family N-acetyltransferase n=1 Tax=Terrisporobacter TaxID=1505652 RepID=UPI000E90CA6E|nr:MULTISPECIES: GNAT family N-acetyltransferase [Terrisporobacter]MBN9646797.1 GNAT family N-acetyltransferase [Terrisporobacter glycolicus]HBI91588.1 GNAT family N-acetyltransferase [Terrisporobacter hibernicus]
MKIRFARECDQNNVMKIWNYCFNDGPKFTDYYFNNKYKNYNTIVVEEEANIVSSLQLNQYKIRLNDKEYETSYVVGVSTLPEARGRGYMKHIMNFTLNELYKKEQLVSILMPIDYRLYRKYGYEHCYDQIEYEINIEDLGGFKSSGSLIKATSDHINEMISIERSFLENLNGKVIRDEDYYKNLFKEIESEDGHIYIHRNEESDGYIIYFINGDNIFVRELYYKNLNALKGMLRFIYNHNTQCKKVNITSPLDDKIRFVLSNPRTVTMKLKPFMMGRVINFKKYLESLYIEGNDKLSVIISIKDNYIKENNKIFKITLENNKLIVEDGNFDYDVEFDINTISQLAFSYINAKEAYLLNNLKENKEIIKFLDLIFVKKENYINEYV